MGLIDSFWGPRDNPQPRKKHGKHRASRGTSSIPPKPLSSAPAPAAEERWSTRTSIEAPTVARQYSDFAGGPASRSGLAAHQSFTPVRGSFVPVQAGPAASPLDWAKQHKYKAAAGVGGAAALLLYFMKPAQASVHPWWRYLP